MESGLLKASGSLISLRAAGNLKSFPSLLTLDSLLEQFWANFQKFKLLGVVVDLQDQVSNLEKVSSQNSWSVTGAFFEHVRHRE